MAPFFGKVLGGSKMKEAKADDAFLRELVGRSVRVVFVDGKALTGRLLAVGTYTLLLGREGARILVYKSALKYVHLLQDTAR
jgi:sRNA-binding regulator protein Hfq